MDTVYKIELIMKQAGISADDRKVAEAANKKAALTGAPAAAIELPDGTVVDPSKFEYKGHGERGPGGDFGGNMPNEAIESSESLTIKAGANYFSFISIKE